MSDVKFQVGDRAKVNHLFDILVPDRDRLIGQEGVVTEVLPDFPERLFFMPDNASARGYGPNGSWAILDYELDKLES